MKKIFSKKTNIDLNEYRIKLFLGKNAECNLVSV
jgi:hypothetical protein